MMKLMWKRISEFEWGAAGERRPFIKTSTEKISLKIHQWRSLRERENKKNTSAVKNNLSLPNIVPESSSFRKCPVMSEWSRGEHLRKSHLCPNDKKLSL